MGFRLGDLAGILTTSAPMLFIATFAFALFSLGPLPCKNSNFLSHLVQHDQKVLNEELLRYIQESVFHSFLCTSLPILLHRQSKYLQDNGKYSHPLDLYFPFLLAPDRHQVSSTLLLLVPTHHHKGFFN